MCDLKSDFGANEASGRVSGAVFEVDGSIYAEVADLLVDAMGSGGYYSGHIDVAHGGWSATLTVSMVIYRAAEALPEGGIRRAVTDIVPVWWEFSTCLSDGVEVLNDFSFAELKKFVLAMHP